MSKRILVSGGAGYIGSHVCKRLSLKGYEPVVIDNLVTGYKSFVQWGPFIEGDIQDKALVKQAVETYKPVAAMNFASYINVGESVGEPLKYYINNVANSLAFFEGLQENGVDNIVFSSTAAVYGNPIQDYIKEDHPYNPMSPYGQSKLMMETALHDMARAYNTKFVIFRYFNAAGSDPDLDIGESHKPETHLIPLIVDALQKRRDAITIFGTDYNTPDGTCIRDYVHVNDLADAHILGVEHLLNGHDSQIFNLGNGKGYSVQEVIDAVQHTSGQSCPVKKGERRAGDPDRLVASSEKATDVLGWQPQITDLNEIIEPVIHWRNKFFG